MKLFENFTGIGLVGLGLAGLDAQIRRGIYRYRGPSRKWLLHDLGHGVERVEASLRGDTHVRCDGYVGHVGNPEVAALLEKTGKPVVNLSGMLEVPEWEGPRVSGEAVGRMAAAYFLSLGHRHLAFVSHGTYPYEQERWEGFRAEAVTGGVDLLVWLRGEGADRECLQVLPDSSRRPVQGMTNWIVKAPRPLALFCASDSLAVRMCDLCHFQQLHIPEDVAVLGVDNFEEVCLMGTTPVSSIALPGENLGWMAAEYLDGRLQGEDAKELKVLSPERVVVRASTDRVAMADPVIAKLLARIRHHAADRTTIAEMCKGLPLNRRSINERFQQELGRSIRDELFRLRVELAKERLMDTDQTVYQIAVECGFSDPESMSAHFKKWVGCTPTAFRKGA
jgi:LacI family transcriptional regulator